MHTIKTIHLSKIIKGKQILNDINLELQSDKIYGIVGQNGSGKTMLFRTLCGLVKPSSGDIIIDGKTAYKQYSSLNKMGVIIENASLYPEFTGLQNLMFLSKINHFIGESEVREAIVRVGLDPDDKRTVKKYSLGMKQRIAIAQAIMEKPDFLLLDEPTNALDVSGVELIYNIIREESKRGALVFIASHNKEDITKLCNETYQMTEGTLNKIET